jgi:hypothetical protein
MCITSKNASLTETKILSFKKENGNVFLSYANTAVNNANGRNCMILPIPGTLAAELFYNTKEYSTFMIHIGVQTVVSEDLEYGKYFKGRTKSMSRGMTLGIQHAKVGMYDVHFSNTMTDLIELNSTLKLDMSSELLVFFMHHYKKFAFICCVFDAKEEMTSQPIALEYLPLHPNMLFYPTMDAHTGKAPTKDEVKVDHWIIGPVKHKKIEITHLSIPDFLNNQEWGTYQLSGDYENGDIYLDCTQDMTKPNLKREYETII